jgi:hypothetical protein
MVINRSSCIKVYQGIHCCIEILRNYRSRSFFYHFSTSLALWPCHASLICNSKTRRNWTMWFGVDCRPRQYASECECEWEHNPNATSTKKTAGDYQLPSWIPYPSWPTGIFWMGIGRWTTQSWGRPCRRSAPGLAWLGMQECTLGKEMMVRNYCQHQMPLVLPGQ